MNFDLWLYRGLKIIGFGKSTVARRCFFFDQIFFPLFFFAFPNAAGGAEQAMRHAGWRSVLFCCWRCRPVAVLFRMTVIGIPIGLVLMLAYPVLPVLDYLCAGLFVGNAAAPAPKQSARKGAAWRIGLRALALMLFAVAASIPLLGGMLVFLAAMTGMGGLVEWLHRRDRRGSSAAEVPPRVWKSGA